ncbi:MAG: AAA family ATPase, partial [Acidimicrobiales bacterium]
MVGRSVIEAKVRAPQLRAVSRDRLHDTLADLWTHRFGLIVAPAGSGKTTLLAQFAAQVEVPVAWYRAEPADATEQALLAHIERGCDGRFDGLATGWESVDDLLKALSAWSGPGGLIVIDEIDALWGTEAEAAIERLIDYLPPGWAILASARRPPGINLSRLRVAGHLLEVGPEDLRFRFWEVERLFRDFYGEPLPPDQLAELTRRTEGWAAGLQLFHLATKGQSALDRGRLLTELGRRSRLMQEYLAANVVDQLPSDLREFLVATSVLGRLTPELCDAVTGRGDSAKVLAELEQARLFTHSTGSGAFRYHEVLRSHLEASLLDSHGETESRDRFRTAGVLLEAAGAVPDALRAYCRAEDWDTVTRLLGGQGEAALDGSASDWIELLPSALTDQDPWLLLGSARRHLAIGRWTAAIDAYQRAEEMFAQGQSAELCRRERRALTMWLEPIAVPGSDWTGALRAATRRDPVAAVSGLRGETPEDAFARATGLVLAGEVRSARRALTELEGLPVSAPLTLGIELVDAVARMLAGEPVVIELDGVGERADVLGLPWIAQLARGFVRGQRTSRRSEDKGDPWAGPLSELLGSMRTLLAGGRPAADLGEVADQFRRVGAPVLEAWARSAGALAAARERRPGAVVLARDAEIRARSAVVPGALALALVALCIADGAHAEAHIRTAREIGDRTGLDIGRLLGSATGPGSAGARRRLVGRDRERDELHAYVDGLGSGRGRTILLTGPSGIGKTRLAEDLAAHAESSSVSVLWAQASSGAGPYWVWGQIVRSHIMSRDLVADPVRSENLAALSRLVPELPELLPNVDLDIDTEATQQEVFEATAVFLRSVAARGPLVIVIDDLHLADATGMHLFSFLSGALVAEPVVLVGAYQERGELGLAGLTAASRLRLGGLAVADVEALVIDATGEQPAGPLVEALAELTEGNPFFILEIARMLAAERSGQLGELGRGDLRLPPSLRDLALGRLAALPDDCRRVLDVAAVIGRTFSLGVLEASVAAPGVDVMGCIGQACEAQLVEEDGPAPATYRFTHGLLQEALYGAVPVAERSRCHTVVGEAIEAISAPLVEPRVPELAHHLLLGAATGDRAKAAAFGRRAATQALDHAAYEDAIFWASASLEALSGLRGHTELKRRLLDLSAQAELAVGDSARASDLLAAVASLGGTAEAVSDQESRLAVLCFGSLRATIAGQEIDLTAMKPRVRSLMRYFALHAGEQVHRDQLIDSLWPGDITAKVGTRNLQTAISSLRHHLEPGVGRGAASILVREGDTYRLVLPATDSTDVRAFESAVSSAAEASRRDDHLTAIVAARKAVALHSADLFEDEGAAEWVQADRDRFRLKAADTAELGATAALAADDLASAVALAEHGVRIDRYRD